MSFKKNVHKMRTAAALAIVFAASGAWAQTTLAPTSGGTDLGQIFRNLTAGLGSFGGLVEGIMYTVGALFALLTLLKLYQWNKSDGRDATLGGIGVTFLVAILGFTMPMLISSGTAQLWGSGQVRTVTAPPAFR